MIRALGVSMLAAICAALAGPVLAQSAYGCAGLDAMGRDDSVEGAQGVFFRIRPELEMFHLLPEAAAEDLGRLSAQLAGTGTSLIYAPLPTRSMAMPWALPELATQYGYDPEIATTLYDRTRLRLERHGVAAPDLRRILRQAPPDRPPFHATDPRLTAEGARRVAAEIARTIRDSEGFVDLPGTQTALRETGTTDLASAYRSHLQRRCASTLPPVTARVFTAGGPEVPDDGVAGPARIVLVGTEVAAGSGVALAGFLAEATGLDVQTHGVAGGGAFAAISSYLTSRDYRGNRPAFIVWANTVSNSLTQQGAVPMTELIAAAGDTCQTPVPLVPDGTGDPLIADLRDLDLGPGAVIYVDAEGTRARGARFDFVAASGLRLSRWVERHPGQIPTGRFYAGLPRFMSADPPLFAEISFDVPMGRVARVVACRK